jgi:hypothetical protein
MKDKEIIYYEDNKEIIVIYSTFFAEIRTYEKVKNMDGWYCSTITTMKIDNIENFEREILSKAI